jgi:hypothetical protein
MSKENEIREKHQTKVSSYLKYVNMVMAVFYAFAGLLIYFYPPDILKNSPKKSLVIAIALILYGAIRGFRSYKSFKSQ